MHRKILKILSLAMFSAATSKSTDANTHHSCVDISESADKFICGPIPTNYQSCDEFYHIDGQTTQHTTSWFLGEYHNRNTHSKSCIEKLTQNISEHTIYIEGYEADTTIPCSLAAIEERPGRLCKGWDDMSARKELASFTWVAYGIHLQLITEKFDELSNTYKKKSTITKKMDSFLKLALTADHSIKLRAVPIHLYEHYSDDIISHLSSIFLEYRQLGYSYKTILRDKLYDANIDVEIPPENHETYRNAHKKRNKQLVRSATSSTTFSIFVVGKAHLVQSEVDPDDLVAAKYTRNEIEGSNLNYAILAMRDI